MQSAILFDCEFLTADGAQSRFWCGPFDPDPTVVQIGAARLGLAAPYPVIETFSVLVLPTDRRGMAVMLDPVFTSLTGITEDRLLAEGRSLAAALSAFAAFCRSEAIWSWGKDAMNLMAISPWVAGIPATIPAARFGNACNLLIRAGVPYLEVQRLRSHTLCAHFGLLPPEGHPHDATFDALSLACAIRHLLSTDRLSPADLCATSP